MGGEGLISASRAVHFLSLSEEEAAILGEVHDIFHEFPEYRAQIEHLKQNSRDFSRLMNEHDNLDKKIRGLEIANQPVTDDYMEELKKQRILLQDQLYELLRQ